MIMCLQPDSVKRNSSHRCDIKASLVSLLHTRNRLVCAPPQPPGPVMRILSGHNSAQTQRQPQGFDTLRPSTLPHKLHNPLTRTLSPPSALLQILHMSTSANKDNFYHGKPTNPKLTNNSRTIHLPAWRVLLESVLPAHQP